MPAKFSYETVITYLSGRIEALDTGDLTNANGSGVMLQVAAMRNRQDELMRLVKYFGMSEELRRQGVSLPRQG